MTTAAAAAAEVSKALNNNDLAVVASILRCRIVIFRIIMLMVAFSLNISGVLLFTTVDSFSIISPISTRQTSSLLSSRRSSIQQRLASTTSSEETETSNNTKKAVILISPPGNGIGEVTAVKVAQQGYQVQWLVIQNKGSTTTNNDNRMTASTSSSSSSVITLSQDILQQIQIAGGSIQFASADTIDLLSSDDTSSLSAITTWCSTNMADTIICTLDGIDNGGESSSSNKKKSSQQEIDNEIQRQDEWKNAIYIATRAIVTTIDESNTSSSTTKKIAILSASDPENDNSENKSNNNNGLLSPLTNLFSGGGSSNNINMNIPTSLTNALMVESDANSSKKINNNIIKLRHGQILFGIAETSNEFTPFINGPRKIPELCNEFANRNIRLDPTYNLISGTNMFKSTTGTTSGATSSGSGIDTTTSRTSRHAIGDAVVAILNMIMNNNSDNRDINEITNLDVCVTSQPGTDIVTPDEWMNEFQRVLTVLKSSSYIGDTTSSSSSSNGVPLFQVEFGSVPNLDRLTDWMTTKWAPAILRTYDIAAIRTGPRPVYANRIMMTDNNNDIGILEIIWQQLINFEPVTMGRMRIEITNTGMKASRIIDDNNMDGTTNDNRRMSLAGEDILVRRLVEAASQAIEKGLATKPKPVIVTAEPTKVVAVIPPMETVTSLQSPEPVIATTAPAATTTEVVSNESGPRVAGARRSTERIRKKSTQPTVDDKNETE